MRASRSTFAGAGLRASSGLAHGVGFPPRRRVAVSCVQQQQQQQKRRAFCATAVGRSGASNPAMAFPCLDALEDRSAKLQSEQLRLKQEQKKKDQQQQQQQIQQTQRRRTAPLSTESGPEPSYTAGATQRYHCRESLQLDWGGVLPEFDIAYETWGTLAADRSNAVLLHTGLSASSHARSTELNGQAGWWERFIGPGPGFALDTTRFFVICTNVIGGCYGSTGPSSIDPADGQRYATRFPVLTIDDMVRAQFRLLDGLGIDRLHASVGASMGGMQSLAAGVLFPDRVGRIVSISGCARSHPYSIAMRHTQRQVLMMDPNWNRGFYYGYDRVPPHAGMKLARQIATVTYRSGPEWEQRFGRRRADPSRPPALCPDFLIETYLDHAGEKFCLTYDPNSLLYVSKAMDLFDLGRSTQDATAARRRAREAAASASASSAFPASSDSSASSASLSSHTSSSPSSPSPLDALSSSATTPPSAPNCTLTLPDQPYEEQPEEVAAAAQEYSAAAKAGASGASAGWRPPEDLVLGLAALRNHPTLVMGVASDILFPAWQQYEVAEALKAAGNRNVSHVELSEEQSIFGHDTFLLDLENIGGNVRNFLG